MLGKFIIHRVASWAGSWFPPKGEFFRESTQDRTTVFLSPSLGGNITSLCHILYPSRPQGEGMTQGHIHQVAGIIVAYLRGFLPQAVSSWKGELQCITLNRRAFLWRWGVAQRKFHAPNARSSRPGGINKMIKLKFKGATTHCLDPCSSDGRLVLLLPCFHWKYSNN